MVGSWQVFAPFSEPHPTLPFNILIFTEPGSLYVFEIDLDDDGVRDSIDNCPSTPNADQSDSNGNNVGDVCDIGAVPQRHQLISHRSLSLTELAAHECAALNLDG